MRIEDRLTPELIWLELNRIRAGKRGGPMKVIKTFLLMVATLVWMISVVLTGIVVATQIGHHPVWAAAYLLYTLFSLAGVATYIFTRENP